MYCNPYELKKLIIYYLLLLLIKIKIRIKELKII